MESSSVDVGFSGIKKASTHPFLDFVDTAIPATSISLDMKPSSKMSTGLGSSYGDEGSPALDSDEKFGKETLDTNVSGHMKAVAEVEESFEKASPGSGNGEMQVESSVPVSVEVVNKEPQQEKEGDCSSKIRGEIFLHPGKQNELHNSSTFQTVEQNQAKQEIESFSAQSPIAIEQNQAKQEVESFSAQSPIAIYEQNQVKQEVDSSSAQSTMTHAETMKRVSNSTSQSVLLEGSSKALGGSKGGARLDVSVKPTWSKADFDVKVTSELEFTMEAMVWPTLAEARDRKPSKHEMPEPVPKPASSKVRGPPQFQKPLSEIQRHDVNALPASKHKSFYKRGNMVGRSNFPASENLHMPPVQNVISLPNEVRKDNGHMGIKGSVASSQWVSGNSHNQAWSRPRPINTANRHNDMNASGRGHPGWHRANTSYGYGQGLNNHFNRLPPPHEFNVAPMYAQPFYNINPAFYNIPNFQMWHAPAGFNNSSMNIAPPGPPKGMHNMFEPMSTEHSIRRQIEYYFSNENLREDIYLKSLMDSEGFVPVPLIARFNRMRKLSSSHQVILDALKNSSVVEVKGDKIRRARDWREFLSSMSERRLTEGTCQTPKTETAVFQSNEDSCPAHEGWTEEKNNNAAGDLIISQNSFEPSSASVLNNDPLAPIPKTVAESDSISISSLQSQGKTKDSLEMNDRRIVEVSHSQLNSYIAVP